MTAADGDDALGAVPGLEVALTAHDSLRTIDATLAPLRSLAQRVVVIDSGSRDGTVERARSHGAEVIAKAWQGHVAQKQFAIDQCAAARWILLLDSDEAIDPVLASAIRAALAADDPTVAGFAANRQLVLHGRPLRHSFQPEWRARLFRRGQGRIAGVPPHDLVEVSGAVRRLAGNLLHHSWADVDDMLRRQIGYARIAGRESVGRGGGVADIVFRPSAAFLKQYLLKRGFRDGWRGLVAAGGAASATLMKHLALAERRGLESESGSEPEPARSAP